MTVGTYTLQVGPFDLTGQTVIPGTNTCTIEAGSDGFEFGQVTAEERVRATGLRDGALTQDGAFTNRVAQFPVRFKAANSSDLARGVAVVGRWCARPDTYTWQHPDQQGVPTTFQAVRAWLSGQTSAAALAQKTEILDLSVECLPFGRSPARRTSPTYPATGAVQQVPIVGSARTAASVEIFGASGGSLRGRKIVVLSHPSLASGFEPRLTAVGGNTGVFRIPLATLPTGAFMLLAPKAPPSGTTRLTVSCQLYRGDPANGGFAVRDRVGVSDRAPSGDVYGVMQLPEPRLGLEVPNGWIELTINYSGSNPNDNADPTYFQNFLLVPLDDEACLTTMVGGTVREVLGQGSSTVGSNRVWLDAATLERPTDEAWEGVAEDRSDSIAVGGLTRWAPPEFRPSPTGTSSVMVWVAGVTTAAPNVSWRVHYWPTWLGMAPE